MFEEFYIDMSIRLAKQLGMTQIEYARRIWPDEDEASVNTKIISLHKGRKGKRQRLILEDAVKFAAVLGRDYPSYCFEIWEKLKMQPTVSPKQSYHAPSDKPKKKSGKNSASTCYDCDTIVDNAN